MLFGIGFRISCEVTLEKCGPPTRAKETWTDYAENKAFDMPLSTFFSLDFNQFSVNGDILVVTSMDAFTESITSPLAPEAHRPRFKGSTSSQLQLTVL